MKDKEVHESIDSIRELIDSAEEHTEETPYWRDFYLRQAQTEAILLLARVIQGRPFSEEPL